MNMNEFFSVRENEKPLDYAVADGGYCGIFRTIACVGDSLSSGEFETFEPDGTRHCVDYFDYSWGQFLARESGNTVYNFSRGGMTAKEYCDGWAADHGWWDPEKACRAYIIAMGCNDVNQVNAGNIEMGSVEDIDPADWRNNKPTFAGYYAQMIQRYREIAPKSRMFLMTLPRGDEPNAWEERAEEHRALLYEIAKLFEYTYVIDLRQYAVPYDKAFKQQFFLSGHMNAVGYQLTAKMVASYIDYIIRHNLEDFCQIGIVNTQQPPDKDTKW